MPAHVRDNALIAVGELVANSVRFGRPPIHVRASVGLSDGDLHSIELIRQASTLRVVLRGDIDLSARPDVDRVLAELDPSHLDRLVIDLRDVTFLDSTGLYMAQLFERWGRDNNVTVVFTRGIPAVMLALRAAGLAQRLTFSDAPEDQP